MDVSNLITSVFSIARRIAPLLKPRFAGILRPAVNDPTDGGPRRLLSEASGQRHFCFPRLPDNLILSPRWPPRLPVQRAGALRRLPGVAQRGRSYSTDGGCPPGELGVRRHATYLFRVGGRGEGGFPSKQPPSGCPQAPLLSTMPAIRFSANLQSSHPWPPRAFPRSATPLTSAYRVRAPPPTSRRLHPRTRPEPPAPPAASAAANMPP